MIVNLPFKVCTKLEEINDVFDGLKISSATILYDPALKHAATSAVQCLPGADFELIEMEKASMEFASSIELKNEIVMGIGGGRAIDVAKYSAFLAKKKWIAFPTVLSHDGIVSSRAVLEDNGVKTSLPAEEPAAIIADMSIIKVAPYRWLAAGCGDVISNISAVEDWRLAGREGKEKYQELIAELALIPYRSVSTHAEEIKHVNEHGLNVLLWSLICSGFAMNIHGSSRPCSGSEHNFSHALDSILGRNAALHGEQVALGTIISTYLHGWNYRLVRDVMKSFDLPTTSNEIGIKPEILIKALTEARNVRDRYTILDKAVLDETMAEKVLKETGIIEN